MAMTLKENNVAYLSTYKSVFAVTPKFRDCLPVFSTNNEKLKKDGIASFNLVAGFQCPAKGTKSNGCYTWCYARFNRFAMSNVMRPRVINYKASLRSDYEDLMLERVDKLVKQGFKRLRWHDSGDFYSKAYLKKVASIVRQSPPQLQHYAYTKMFHKLDMSVLFEQERFNMIQSEGGIHDEFIDYDHPLMGVSRVFSDRQQLIQNKFVDCSVSDLKAANGHKKIGLIIHGNGSRFFSKDKSTGLILKRA